MLDVRLFTNPRFAAASGAVTAAFFGLFGFIFMITQYFQAVHGYSALRAGVATLPFAGTVIVLSPVGILLAKRFGSTVVVTGGLLLMSTCFSIGGGITVDSLYSGRILVVMMLMAAGLALIAGPATEAIMGALAPCQGWRRLGGQRHHAAGRRRPGVAVIGSVMSSFYGPHMLDVLRHLGTPGSQLTAAHESIVGGLQVAAGLHSAQALDGVRSAFVDGRDKGSLVAAGVTAAAAIAVLIFLPSRGRNPADEAERDVTAAEVRAIDSTAAEPGIALP